MAARNADLEAEIIADPDSSAAYLVYADWLLSRDDPRGELILIQLELETARGRRWAELKLRELELLTQHAGQFFGPASSARFRGNFDWRRGFIDRMRADFVTDEGEQLIAHPSLALVRAVSNVEFPEVRAAALPLLGELAVEWQRPRPVLAMATLRHLALDGYRAGILLAQPDVQLEAASGLETLAVPGYLELIEELASCQFPSLRAVHASWSACDEAEIDAMLAFVLSTPHAELDLTISDEYRTAPSLAGLDERRAGRRVRSLRIHDPSVEQLRGLRGKVPRLQRLQVSGIAGWSPAHVAELPMAPRLSALLLDGRLTQPETVAAIATSPYAATVQQLKLPLTNPSTLRALGRAVFPSVRVLETRWNAGAEPADLSAMSDSFPALEELVVDLSDVTEVSKSALAAQVHTLAIRLSGAQPDHLRFSLGRSIDRFRALRCLRLIDSPPLTRASLEALGAMEIAIALAPNVRPLVPLF